MKTKRLEAFDNTLEEMWKMGFPEVWRRGSQVARSLTVSMIVLVLCQSVAVTQETKPPGVPTLPAHVLNDPELFERTMAHISDDDLIAALDLDRPELKAVREAAAKNTRLALEALGAHMERRERPVDVVDAATYRDELRSYHKAFPNKNLRSYMPTSSPIRITSTSPAAKRLARKTDKRVVRSSRQAARSSSVIISVIN